MKVNKMTRMGLSLLGLTVAFSCAAVSHAEEKGAPINANPSVPAGVQDNEGLAEHGKATVQGQHAGFANGVKEEQKTEHSQAKNDNGEVKKEDKETSKTKTKP